MRRSSSGPATVPRSTVAAGTAVVLNPGRQEGDDPTDRAGHSDLVVGHVPAPLYGPAECRCGGGASTGPSCLTPRSSMPQPCSRLMMPISAA